MIAVGLDLEDVLVRAVDDSRIDLKLLVVAEREHTPSSSSKTPSTVAEPSRNLRELSVPVVSVPVGDFFPGLAVVDVETGDVDRIRVELVVSRWFAVVFRIPVDRQQLRLEARHRVDERHVVVIGLEVSCDVLCPRELGGVEVDEDVRVGDIALDVGRRLPAVSHLAGFDRIHERHLVAADVIGPVPEGENAAYPVGPLPSSSPLVGLPASGSLRQPATAAPASVPRWLSRQNDVRCPYSPLVLVAKRVIICPRLVINTW